MDEKKVINEIRCVGDDMSTELEKELVPGNKGYDFATRAGIGVDAGDEGDKLPVVTVDDLREGAKKYEMFWLRPKCMCGEVVPLRLRVSKKISGWKLKDELVEAIGLTVGDTISTEVSILFAPGIIDDAMDDMDLFADGDAASWLIDTVMDAGTVEGCVIDCFVRFSYFRTSVGIAEDRWIWRAALVLERGIKLIRVDEMDSDKPSTQTTLRELLASAVSAN